MAGEATYEDRRDAGEQLAAALRDEGIDGDVVLGIPRGALPVAGPVADALDLPLDVTVGRKVGHPEEPDFAIGAVAADGSAWIDDDAVEQWDVTDAEVADAVERERETVREKLRRYRDGGPRDVTGETVVVVDDGAATGATARVCVEHLQSNGAARVVLAVPVASPIAMDALEPLADDVVCPLVPSDMEAVWEYYEEFGQVSDDEAVAYLD